MNLLQSIFNRAGDLYAQYFAEWLHIHFVIRTAILLLILWGALFVVAMLLMYVFGPIVVLFYRHIIFRWYNYWFVETPHEWLYIRYYAKDKPNFRAWYLRLSDKVKKNRLILHHTRYRGILYRGYVKRFTWVLIATVGFAATLWLTAFGLHQEYYVPALAGYANGTQANQQPGNAATTPGNELPGTNGHPGTAQPGYGYAPYYPNGYVAAPFSLPEYASLRLNELGANGARLRDMPSFAYGRVIEMVWGNHVLTYLNVFQPDDTVPGLYWLRVLSPEGVAGYIASYLFIIE